MCDCVWAIFPFPFLQEKCWFIWQSKPHLVEDIQGSYSFILSIHCIPSCQDMHVYTERCINVTLALMHSKLINNQWEVVFINYVLWNKQTFKNLEPVNKSAITKA